MSSVRRLTAILAADVAGYSRLMGADEGARVLNEYRVLLARGSCPGASEEGEGEPAAQGSER